MSVPQFRTARAAPEYLLPEHVVTFPVKVRCGCGERHRNMQITAEGIDLLRRSGAPGHLVFESWRCRDGCKQIVKITVRQLVEAAKLAA
jgi:hypothetical protein